MKVIIDLTYKAESLTNGHWNASFEFEEDSITNYLTEEFKTKMDAFHAVVKQIEEELVLPNIMPLEIGEWKNES